MLSPSPVPNRNVIYRWQEHATEWLDWELGRFLDYGCGPCGLLNKVQSRCDECFGVDVDKAKIEMAKCNFPHFNLQAIEVDGRTPFPDNYFDTVAIVEVIEHVGDERATLQEISRILKPGGKLLLTTPHRGLLTFLDLGNFKFVFPRLHRFIHLRILRKPENYQEQFVSVSERGLIGDITVSKNRCAWHRHYSQREIESHCPPSLRTIEGKVYFPAMRAFMLLRAMVKVITRGRSNRLIWPLSHWEIALSRVCSVTGDQLLIMFVKDPSTIREAS